MADEPTKEPGAKRARVDETSHLSLQVASTEAAGGGGTSDRGTSDRGSNRMNTDSSEKTTTGSSIGESVAGSNREGGDFLMHRHDGSDADDDYHNYSITARWRKRCAIWEQWRSDNVFDDSFDLDSLQLLTGDELFLKIDDSSLLGKVLVDFAADIQALKDDVRTLEEEIASREAESETLREQVSSLTLSALQPDTELFEKLIAANTELIAAKTELIAEKTERIAANTKLIAANTKLIAANTKLIATQKELDANNLTKVDTFFNVIFSAHREMRNKFSYVKAKGNESILTITSEMQSLDLDRIDTSKTSSPSEFDDFRPILNCEFRDELIQWAHEDKNTKDTLCHFRQFVAELFTAATKTNNNELVKNTTDALRNWEPGATVNAKKDYYARPPTDEDTETTADHPILHAVICRIIGILVDSGQNQNPEDKVLQMHECGVTTEQSVAGSILNMKERRIDVTAHQRKEHLSVMLATMVRNAFEIKTGPDSKRKFNKAVEKGRSQVVGHLGKRLLYAFDFGGAGINDHAVGVSLTPLSIEVIKMSLSDVGTKDVALEVIGTGCVPLLGEEHLEPEQKDAFQSLDINGFVLLAGALKHGILQESGHLKDASVKQVRPCEENLTGIVYLGSGAFFNVVQLKPGEFMKMPKSAPLAKILIQEAAILRKLQSGKVNSSIPQLVVGEDEGVSSIQTVIRGEISNVQCLRLSGVVGLPLNNISREDWDKHAQVIITTVYEALEYAHCKSIYHLDVKPGNIIVKYEQARCCVMLSDWGCSVDGTKTTTLKSFRGCTPYAHDRLLGAKFQGKLGPELDFASLAYTVDHVKTGRLRWIYEFDRPLNVGSSDLDFRRECVEEWLVKDEKACSLLPPRVQEAMVSACRQ